MAIQATLVIRLRGVTKEFRQGDNIIHALNGIDLEIGKGEFVAVMGPSGCGKSTLMYTLGFLDRPTSGTYEFNGRDSTSLSETQLAAIRNGEIGFIFQNYNLLARTTVLDNVLLPTVYAEQKYRNGARDRALALLEKVNMTHRLRNNPNQLSGGEQQRAAIARALINSPSLLLADEPTGNLDSKTSVEVMAIMASLNREGNTIVMVTHEENIAAHASRVVRLKDGRVVSDERR